MARPATLLAAVAAIILLGCAGGAAGTPSSPPAEGGSDPFRFRYRPDLLRLPPSVEMANGHGLAKDRHGRIYFTYEPARVTPDTRALVRFAPDGSGGELLGEDSALAMGVPHGLRLSEEPGGDFLYHANNAHAVHKTDLQGRVMWSNNLTAAWAGGPFWPCLPTDAVVPPGSDVVYVADGYGSSYVHLLDVHTGEYVGTSFGGKGNSTSPQRFDCPHGITYDEAAGALLVSDRANSRLQYVGLDGRHRRGVAMGNASEGAMPDNVDFSEGRGAELLVPSLDGALAVLSGGARPAVLSVLDIAALLGPACPHPHDAIFLDSGDIALCCWAPGHLSYWERLPPAEGSWLVPEGVDAQ